MVPCPGTEIVTVEGSGKVHRLIKEWRDQAEAWERAFQPELGLRAQQLKICADALSNAVQRYDIPPFMPVPIHTDS